MLYIYIKCSYYLVVLLFSSQILKRNSPFISPACEKENYNNCISEICVSFFFYHIVQVYEKKPFPVSTISSQRQFFFQFYMNIFYNQMSINPSYNFASFSHALKLRVGIFLTVSMFGFFLLWYETAHTCTIHPSQSFFSS